MNALEALTHHWTGQTKPVAKSLEILSPYIEYVQGSTEGKFHIMPFAVKLTNEGKQALGLDNPFICKRRELHRVAEIARSLTNK